MKKEFLLDKNTENLLLLIAKQQQELATLKPHLTNMKFSSAYESWLKEHRLEIALSTYQEYERIYRVNIRPYFQEFLLTSVTVKNIHNFYNERRLDGVKEETIARVHSNLFTFFKYAKAEGWITDNPFDRVKRPTSKESFVPEHFKLSQIQELLLAVKGHKLFAPILLSSIFGLRRSEVAGFEWDSINLIQGTIKVKRKIMYDRKASQEILTKRLKNISSYRTLPMPEFALEALKVIKEYNLSIYKNSKDKNFVCLDEKGQRIRLNYLSSDFPKWLAANGFPVIRFHDLRHSCAIALLELGYSMKDIQEWLGHSTYHTTAKYYTRVDMERKNKISNNLNNAFTQN